MIASMSSLAGWALVGTFALIIVLALACFFFIKGLLDLRLAKELSPLEKTKEQLEAEIRAKKEELAARISELTNADKAVAEANEAREFLKKYASEFASKQAQLATIETNLKATEARFKEASVRCGELENRLNALHDEVGKLDAQRIALQKDCSVLETDKTRLTGEIERLRREIPDLEAKRKVLLDEVADLEVKAERVKELRKEVLELEAKVATLKALIEELEKTKASLTVEVGKIKADIESTKPKNVWEDLYTPVVTEAKRKIAAETTNELNWLTDFDKLLRSHGFRFPERTLRAFHTGLKCGEMTPLVVLAGISGTGKSLLPELYAAAAGMNFLSVPVQPRWDGPQDVLGFYNYMEKRYKATELARFLWQADSWNNKDKSRVFSPDSLNIVLLDEMNLARVEYYFADFLSKLEQRRGKDLNDPEQRKAVELFLECGAGLGGQNLCVGTNTFFIGTMNEDETTQMLSDKVIDRSNLLRFGRPHNTQVHPNKGAFLKACTGRAKVTLPVWAKWMRTEALHQQDYQPLLKELNDALDNVGRPFAYRVQQSIDAYMAAYPDQNDWRNAFADQIEMKVLPKLNGLEIASSPKFAETASTIQKIAEDLEDTELRDEFERASNVDNTFFRWRGVKRKDNSDE